MKILSVNGSPHKAKGNTHMVTSQFLMGAKEAGAEVEEVFLQGLDINGCIGCYTCWLKTPQKCIHRDDMNGLLEKVIHADILLLSTPVYLDGISAQAKTFLDRLVAILDAHFTLVDGHCRHRKGISSDMPDFFLISTCGFSEMDNFDPVVDSLKKACLNLYMDYRGELLRPASHFLRLKDQYPDEIKIVLDAALQAGKEFVRDGKVSKVTFEKVSLPFCRKDEFIEKTNYMWDSILEKR